MENTNNKNISNGLKTLIVFYSFDGNTKFIANEIQKLTGSNILELKLKKEMKSHGFSKFFWGGKSVMQKQTPELLEFNVSFNEYDRVFIGTPVWAGTFAPALRTFFKDYKLENKEIILFACYGGSESGTFEKMKQEVGNNNKFLGQIGFKEPLQNKDENIQKLTKFLQTL